MRYRYSVSVIVLILVLAGSGSDSLLAQRRARSTSPASPPASVQPFDVYEQSILDLQAAQTTGRVTSRGLVDAYLARIAAYDHAGPQLNAIVVLNPHAGEEAEALDRERAEKGPRGPLHGIPLLLKDNYNTVDMPTSGGTLALATMHPSSDAFQVQRLREAGAVILGKTAMHELAAGITTISSLTGQTRNPYDLLRVPGGSSGGTGAAVAASFAAAGMGSDTCGSIRIPAAHQNLVGLRPTLGLSSRHGVIPLSTTQDIAGPLARTVTDLALIFDATVGPDPSDPVTADAALHRPRSYRDGLDATALKGARIGVIRSFFGTAPEDAEAGDVVRKALDQMKGQGAEVVDVVVPGLDDLLNESSVIADEFKFDLADYLAAQPKAPVKSLGEIIEGGLAHEQLDRTFRLRDATEQRESEHYRQALIKRRTLRVAVLAALEEQRVIALAYPVIRRKAALIGETQFGTNCQLSATTGLPAISMPAGFTPDGMPIGIELLGGAFAEPQLLSLAYAWEQSAKPRRPPFSTPPLMNGLAPIPVSVTTELAGARGTSAHVVFTYDAVTGTLRYTASVGGLGTDRVVALTLQRGEADRPGPVVAHLMLAGHTSATAALTMRGSDRERLVAGKLYVHLYTLQSPLGAGRAVLAIGADTADRPTESRRPLPLAPH